MDEIKGQDLSELVRDATQELLLERKSSAISAIKKIFQKYDGIDRQIREQTKALDKSVKSKEKLQNKIKELKNGNWNVLNENENKQGE